MTSAKPPNKLNAVRTIKRLRKIPQLKKIFGYVALDLAFVDGSPVIVRGHHVCNHDLYHVEVSRLERIPMGKYMVSGIHGINSPIFHDSVIKEEYDANFDEARIAIHEWLTRTSLTNTFKLVLWIGWLLLNGVNPWKVILNHQKALKQYRLVNDCETKASSNY